MKGRRFGLVQSDSVARSQPSTLSPASAHFAAWVLLSLVNAWSIAMLPAPAAGPHVRLLHHLYDAGQLIGAGLVTAACIAAFQLLPQWIRRGWLGYAAGASVSVVLGFVAAKDSLRGFSERMAVKMGYTGHGDPEPYWSLFVVALALSVPAVLLVGRFLRRPGWRWVAVAGGIGAALVNEGILENSYPGAHFYLSWTAACMMGQALTGLRLPYWSHLRVAASVVYGTSLPLCLWSLSVWPDNSVLTELYKLDGAVLLPLIAEVHGSFESDPELLEVGSGERPDVSPSQPPLLSPRNGIVILITVDSLRYEVVAQDALASRWMPHTKQLRDSGAFFTKARTTAASTRLTMAGIFAGRFWSQLPWKNIGSGRPVIEDDPTPRFPELLVNVGVTTVTYVSEHRALINEAGIVRGFQEQTVFPPRSLDHPRDHELSPKLVAAMIHRLERADAGPMFFFAHFMDPHYPYDAGGTDVSPFMSYLRECKLVDESLGRLIQAITRLGLAQRTAIIFGSDHGEGFGQHQTRYHDFNLYEELIHVPLIIKIPGLEPKRISAEVSTIDLGPTILDLMGAVTPGIFMGESLVPLLRGKAARFRRPIAAERQDMRAMVGRDGFKVIVNKRKRTEELYDLTTDPHETHNLRDELPDRGDKMLAELKAFFRRNSAYAPEQRQKWTAAHENPSQQQQTH